MIIKQYEVGNFTVFCYLIGDEETQEGLFIDPADDATRLLAEAKSNGLNKIKYIVNTHSHVDHIMGNAEMLKNTGAKLIIHAEDAAALSHTPSYLLEMFGATPSPPADIVVKEGDAIQVGHVNIKVIHTPDIPGWNVPPFRRNGVYRRYLFVGSVGRTISEVHGMLETPSGKALCLTRRDVVFPAIITDPHPPRPSNTRDGTIPLSEGKSRSSSSGQRPCPLVSEIIYL
jgi:hypothetical protein